MITGLRFIISISLFFAASILPVNSFAHNTKIKIVYTTDVHGNFFPVDYITMSPMDGSLSRVVSAIDSIRETPGGNNLILLDNGDFLQGQPSVYYYNYIDTISPHLASEIYNYIGYDATTIGNHDVETGHAVYDRWRSQNRMPLLGANVIDNRSGQPYLEPYVILEKDGVRIAVLGLITPAIPAWLPENLWSGLAFEDMVTSAKKWIPIIKSNENPDIIIGLFHSGHDETMRTGEFLENASLKIAREVPGFDALLIGHDHQKFHEVIENMAGEKVTVLNPANNAKAVGLLEFDVKKSNGKLKSKKITSIILDITGFEPDKAFLEKFAPQREKIGNYVARKIGNVSEEMSIDDAFFGPSSFMSFLHRLQLDISGADISFAAPLSFGAVIRKGPMKVSDTFTLYKYENMLYVIKMTGREIKNYLEESYSIWTRQITDRQPHLINFKSENPSLSDNRLAKPAYNFDSAAGIDYTVDVTKPKGEKINIASLSDGRSFSLDSTYTVAINSYRANGGGNLLSDGAGISREELKKRIVSATDKDLRYYLIDYIEKHPDIEVQTIHNWKFIPDGIAEKAAEIDRELLFSPQSLKEQK